MNPLLLPENQQYPIIQLTFGLELEFHFVALKSSFNEWAKNNNTRTPSVAPSATYNGSSFQFSAVPDDVPPELSRETADTASTDMNLPEQPRPRLKLRRGEKGDPILPTSFARSTESTADELQAQLLQYLLAFLNRKLPFSPKTPSLLGEVAWDEPKVATSSSWHLTHDGSLFPHREQFFDAVARARNIPIATVKILWWCVGAELVSCVLNYDQDDIWFPMLQQISDDLEFGGIDRGERVNDVPDTQSGHGAWFNDEPNLHVHFAIKDDELQLHTVQNLIALYGLFEREIEQWLQIGQRDSVLFCPSLRKGMEYNRYFFPIDPASGFHSKDPSITEGRLYTPQEFTKRIYATRSLDELKGEVCGIRSDPEWNQAPVRPTIAGMRETIEFRHYHGTKNPQEIRWWVGFCGALLKFSHTAAVCGNRFVDEGRLREPNKVSFVGRAAKECSILDIIDFPPEGKAHFQNMANMMRDAIHDEKRKMEDRIIGERIKLRLQGYRPNGLMDKYIRLQPWYTQAKATLDAHRRESDVVNNLTPKNKKSRVSEEARFKHQTEDRYTRISGYNINWNDQQMVMNIIQERIGLPDPFQGIGEADMLKNVRKVWNEAPPGTHLTLLTRLTMLYPGKSEEEVFAILDASAKAKEDSPLFEYREERGLSTQ